MQKEYKAKLLRAAKDYVQTLEGTLEAIKEHGFSVILEETPGYELIDVIKTLLDNELEPVSRIVAPNIEYYESSQLASSMITGTGDWLTEEMRETCCKNAEALFDLADNAVGMDETAIKARFTEIIGH